MAGMAQPALHKLLLPHGGDVEEAASPARAAGFVLLVVSFVLLPLLLLRRFGASKDDDDNEKLLSRLPSPNKLPVLGHMHLVGPLPHVSLAALAAKHGPDLMLLRLGAVPTLVASSPRAAEAVLRTHDHAFASRPRSMVADIILYGASESCYAPYGEHFRKMRKLGTAHLLSSRKVQSYRPAREEEVARVVDRLAAASVAHAVVDLTELLHTFTNDLICRAVSGNKFPREEEGRNKVFRELIDANAALLGGFNLEDYFPRLAGLQPLSKIICAKARKISRRWDQLLNKIIDDHVARLKEGASSDAKQLEDSDFIDVLLSLQEEYGLTRDHIKATGMFEAGTDSSYLVLEVTMAELMRNPHVMTKLQDEVRSKVPKGQKLVTEDDVTSMTYLRAVIKETLRLHPPAPLLIPHLSMEDCEVLDGYTIPAGTRVIVNAWAIGRRGDLWENPDGFLPERFMGSTDDVDLRGQADFRYLPFGAGRRMCPGIHSAAATILIMLVNLMYNFDWELSPGMEEEDIDMTEVFGLAVHLKEELFLVPKLA